MTAKRSETDVPDGDARPDTVRDLNRFQSRTVPPEQARAMMEVDLRAVDDGALSGTSDAPDEIAEHTPEPAVDPEPHELAPAGSAPRGRQRAVVIGVMAALLAGLVALALIGKHAPAVENAVSAERAPHAIANTATPPAHAAAPAPPASATTPPRASAATPPSGGTASSAPATAPHRGHLVERAHAKVANHAAIATHPAPRHSGAGKPAPDNSSDNSGFPY